MRLCLFLFLLVVLSPCIAADEPTPPNGQQILQIFFQNINIPLKDEQWCQMLPWRTFDGLLASEGDYEENDPKFLNKTLAEFVAAQIGDSSASSLDDDDYVGPVIHSECTPGLRETDNPDFPKGWFCRVSFIGGTREYPRETATTVQMVIKPDLSGIIPGTIACL